MVGAAGFTFGVALGVPAAFRLEGGEAHAAGGDVTINPYVTISTDGTVAIMSPAAEMGQGSLTSLPLILAEELDADWAKVRIVPAPPIEKLYGNPGFGGLMYTAGSFAVNGYFKALRTFGAQVRHGAARERGASLGRAAGGADDAAGRGGAREVRPAPGLRRDRGVCGSAGQGARDHAGATEEDRRFSFDRQGRAARRIAGQGQWRGAVQHRRAGAGHDLRRRSCARRSRAARPTASTTPRARKSTA